MFEHQFPPPPIRGRMCINTYYYYIFIIKKIVLNSNSAQKNVLVNPVYIIKLEILKLTKMSYRNLITLIVLVITVS